MNLRILLLFLPALALHGETGTLEKIVLFGNTRTKSDIILRELRLREGSPWSLDLLSDERAWLLRQDFLKRIEFQLKPGSTDLRSILMLVVQEKGMIAVSPVLSNQDVYGWYAGTGITLRNLLGYRNRVDIIAQLGGLKHFEFRVSNPWIFRSLRLFAEFRIYRTSFRYRFSDFPSSFDERDTGVSFTLGKGIGRTLHLGLCSGFERVWAENPEITVSPGRHDNIFLLEPFLRYDTRDWPLYPKYGWYLNAWVRRYGIQRGFRPERIGIDIRAYTPAYRDNILAVQAVAEISHGTVPVYKRIHIGGGRTIRGFSTGDLSCENSALISIEYRIPVLYIRNPTAGLHAGYAVVLFSDMASTWYRIADWTPRDIRACLGIGVHAIWDHFVLRGEYGYRGKGLGFINVGTGVKF